MIGHAVIVALCAVPLACSTPTTSPVVVVPYGHTVPDVVPPQRLDITNYPDAWTLRDDCASSGGWADVPTLTCVGVDY